MNLTPTKPDRTHARLVRSIISQAIQFEFCLEDRREIPRQSSTVIPVNDGQGSTVTVRGKTNLTVGHWAVYRGQFGTWSALINGQYRVGPAYPVVEG